MLISRKNVITICSNKRKLVTRSRDYHYFFFVNLNKRRKINALEINVKTIETKTKASTKIDMTINREFAKKFLTIDKLFAKKILTIDEMSTKNFLIFDDTIIKIDEIRDEMTIKE